MTKGAAPCAVKVACTVLNGGDEETYRKATRLVPTQREPGSNTQRVKHSSASAYVMYWSTRPSKLASHL
jgi:hypothetical protein